MFRSDVIADKFPHDDTHRCGKVLIYPHQQFIEADGEQLPFEKDAFDYVICNQVLEHADNPARFIEKMVRVDKRGYVETPSMLGELMFPKESHRWVILLIEDKLVFYEKEKMPGNYRNNYGEVFLNYLPYQSLPFKMLYVSEPNLLLNRIEWEGTIEYLVNPEDDYYSSFFTRKWNREMTMKIFPPRRGLTEINRTLQASYYLVREKLGQKIHKRPSPITLVNGPSEAKSIPMMPTWNVFSFRWLFPLRSFMSKTPETALPYSAGKAPVKKSEFPKTCALSEERIPPPKVAISAKWFGFGISTSSSRHCNKCGALPWMDIPLLETLGVTPANEATSRAGSSNPPA